MTPGSGPAPGAREALRGWLSGAAGARQAGMAAVVVLVVAGLLLPPVSMGRRLTTLGYTSLQPGRDSHVAAPRSSAALVVSGRAIQRRARAQLREDAGAASRLPPLPAGHEPLSSYYRLDIAGPAPRQADIELTVAAGAGDHPFVDGFGWDGRRWRWLAPAFFGSDRLRLSLPLDQFVPQHVVATVATRGATEVAAALLPPPASVPAAMAELPILELRAYHLASGEGHVSGRRFAVPDRDARVYGLVDNLEGERLRTDLVNNMLILPRSRQRLREALLDIVRRDRLAGLVLDFRGIDSDLQRVYSGVLGRLAHDLHSAGAELIVVVPMPQRTHNGWDGGSYNWQELATAADGLRVALPNDRPLTIEALDSLVQWALPRVERGRLQLAVPVRGRDVTEDAVTLIGYGDALAKVLDLAASDVPRRIDPATTAAVTLPTLERSELGLDPATGMWRFHYWDDNRRQHTVWLNDAAGLQPAFDIAARYRLGRVALDGVSSGLDPSLWRMVKEFEAGKPPVAPSTAYRLQWRLMDETGRTVQEALQPLEDATFQLRAPLREGSYRLGVNLVTGESRIAALGNTTEVRVAPAPPANARPTELLIVVVPTPEMVETAPPPRDEEVVAERTPVRIGQAVATLETDYDAVVSFAEGPLRAAPDFAAAVVTDLRVGDRLKVLGTSDDGAWLHAKQASTGLEGWVRKELVLRNAPVAATGPARPSSATPTARPSATPGSVGRRRDG